MTSPISNGRYGSIPETLSATSPTSTAPSSGLQRSTALSSRITSVLSTSYADIDIRNTLETLDARGFENTQDARRNLRLDIQQEVIGCNGEIIKDFGSVAQVRVVPMFKPTVLTAIATKTHWKCFGDVE